MATLQQKDGNPVQTLGHIQTHLQKAQDICTCKCGAAAEIAEALNQVPRLQEEIEALKTTIEDRKIIERAKGIIMHRCALCENDAYRHLQKFCTTRNKKMIEVAKLMIEAEEVMKETSGNNHRY